MGDTYIMRKGHSTLSDLKDGYLGLGAYAVGAKSVYYVDGNIGVAGAHFAPSQFSIAILIEP